MNNRAKIGQIFLPAGFFLSGDLKIDPSNGNAFRGAEEPGGRWKQGEYCSADRPRIYACHGEATCLEGGCCFKANGACADDEYVCRHELVGGIDYALEAFMARYALIGGSSRGFNTVCWAPARSLIKWNAKE